MTKFQLSPSLLKYNYSLQTLRSFQLMQVPACQILAQFWHVTSKQKQMVYSKFQGHPVCKDCLLQHTMCRDSRDQLEIQRMFIFTTGAHDPSHLIITFLTYRWRSHITIKLSAIASRYLLYISNTIFGLHREGENKNLELLYHHY